MTLIQMKSLGRVVVGSVFFRNKIYLTSIAISILAAPLVSLAKGYQYEYEVFGAYANTEDEGSTFENTRYDLGISIYDRPVGYGDHPYLLANFFERRTHLDFNYMNIDSESDADETAGDSYGINYSFASVGSPVLFNLGASRLVGDGTDAVGDYDLDATAFFFGFGYYLTPNSVASISVTATDYRLSDDINPDVEYDQTNIEANWQHVLKVGSENYVAVLFDVEAIEIGSSKNSEVGIFVDYYVNQRVGIGAGYSAYRGDFQYSEGETLTLSASAFMNKQFGFTGEIGRFFADLPNGDEDNIYLEAIARFN